MNTKKVIFLTLMICVILAVLIGLYLAFYTKNEISIDQANKLGNTILEQEAQNSIVQNAIDKLLVVKNIVSEIANEEAKKADTTDTKEKSNNQSNTSSTKKSNVKKVESKKDTTKANTKKNETTNTKKKTTVTAEAAGEYDIKNGGTAIYTESVTMPQEWLDY